MRPRFRPRSSERGNVGRGGERGSGDPSYAKGMESMPPKGAEKRSPIYI